MKNDQILIKVIYDKKVTDEIKEKNSKFRRWTHMTSKYFRISYFVARCIIAALMCFFAILLLIVSTEQFDFGNIHYERPTGFFVGIVIFGMTGLGCILYVINKTYLKFLIFTPIFAMIIVGQSNGSIFIT